ncbi:unnamed protein product [Acanthoscelides obtectus]|nr:unnamed protein product [Acanthoscelides obtectus]CAK1664233.1 hypothetical protein AOBTE_LOCUS24145 [Acanthoscelides obtectus]
MVGVSVFYSLLSLACVFLIMGAYQCRRVFIYPFLYLYIGYVAIGFVQRTLIFMYLIKQANGDLGTMILYYTIEFFIVLLHIYTWACVYNLIKALKSVEVSVTKRILHKARIGYLAPIRVHTGMAA